MRRITHMGLIGLIGLIGFMAFSASAQTFSADLTGDGKVNFSDLVIVITNWKKTGSGDINRDGIVNFSDLVLIIQQWAPTPTPTPTATPTPPPAGACGPWPAGITQWIQPLAQSTGQVFYVSPSGSDSNPGTLSAPWQTIDKAFSSLQPGQIAYLRAGTYGARGTTKNFNRIGTVAAPITVSGYPGDAKPVLQGRYYMSGQYIRLTNIIIDGPTGNVGGPGPNGEGHNILLTGSHLELSNSEVRYSYWHAGVDGNATDYRIIGNYLHDNGGLNGDYNDDQWNNSHGAYLSPSYYGLIANNVAEHNDAKGLMGRHDANHLIFANNTVVGNGRYGIDTTESTNNWIVANNIALNNGNMGKGGGGIYLQGTGPYTQMNNVFWNNNGNNNYNTGTNITLINPKVADPLLVSPDSGTVAFQNLNPNTNNRLRSGSPAIGYADKNYTLPFDFTGKCRDAAPDAGAFEF